MKYKFHKGLDLNMGAGPTDSLPELAQVSKVALSGNDFPGISFDLLVAEGDTVSAGQVLFIDRNRHDIRFVTPVSGQITNITLGARRRLDTLVMSVEGNEAIHFDTSLASINAAGLKSLLLASGAWAGFRSRPFGDIPNPDERPAAIFVTATDTNPLAADPAAVLSSQLDIFQQGADSLLHLTDGPVYICQAPGSPLVQAQGRLKIATFAGPHPSGLAGTHIHHLMPVSKQRSVWEINYQDLAAIGSLLTTGRIMGSRTLSLAGSGITKPVFMNAPMGASLTDLIRNKADFKDIQLISGSVLSGREASYLGRYDLQVTAIDRDAATFPVKFFWQRFLDKSSISPNGATIPMESFERALPLNLLPVPLMRALAVGDIETAERLGCLELLEDDLAILTCLCPSGSDYGALLRSTLDSLAEEAVTV